MKKKSVVSLQILVRMVALASVALVAGCTNNSSNYDMMGNVATPTVDYVERLDVYSAPHKDSFLNQLAMNYRSYAIYNARTSGYPEMGELFAQKAVAAFSGELPFPETLDNWPVDGEQESFELYTAYNDLMEQLKNDASDVNPELAAEVQAKFDCWLSASASGQSATAKQCRDRYYKAMTALRDCSGGKVVSKVTATPTMQETVTTTEEIVTTTVDTRGTAGQYYADTRSLSAMRGASSAREGVIIVNNVNVPEHLIKPVPVQPMVFNQNIYGGDKTITKTATGNNANNTAVITKCGYDAAGRYGCKGNSEQVEMQNAEPVQNMQPQSQQQFQSADAEIPMIGDQLVSRDEFINMMMAMRAELAAINARLDKIQAQSANASTGEKTVIKVQQIPLEPKQHVMEEVFEIRFDFNKAVIKPEYEDLIQKLASATQANKNIKVSVIGHTDTVGSSNYNYALGGRRADAVQKMLIKYGIPASQIVAVSAGEEDLAVQTGDNVANAANRRVQVIKEVHYTEDTPGAPITLEVEEYSDENCGIYGCGQ
ncbi:MAG: OmpA family protein [Alphaproteobacteria bacterium]|nr:OmpA family protein [Alphaproteobacteria bacterium]